MKQFILTFFLLSQTVLKAQTIDRIEPQNWWVGMKYNTITLLVYGKNISELQPSISYKGVSLVKKEKFENKNYLL